MTTNLYHRQNNKTKTQKTQKNGNGLTMNRELFIIGTFYYYYFFIIIIITIRTLFFFGNNNQVVYWTFIIEAFIILKIFLLQSPGRLGFKSFYIYIFLFFLLDDIFYFKHFFLLLLEKK